MAKQTNLDDFLHTLEKQVAGELRTDQVSRILYSTDASIYQVMPHGVFLPRTPEDIQAAVELAAKYQIPLLPRAAGSSLALHVRYCNRRAVLHLLLPQGDHPTGKPLTTEKRIY